MDFVIKKELEEFLEFKKNYKFEQKELVIEGDLIYCDKELIQEYDDLIGESDKWINVGYNLKGKYSKILSNLFPYEFTFRGKKFSSIEGFFQGIKFPDKDIQEYVYSYFGVNAINIKNATDYDWTITHEIYFMGQKYDRFSKEYSLLIDELYISAIQNPLYRKALLNCDKPILHTMGETDKNKTTFTRYEFEYELNCLSAFLKNKETKKELI